MSLPENVICRTLRYEDIATMFDEAAKGVAKINEYAGFTVPSSRVEDAVKILQDHVRPFYGKELALRVDTVVKGDQQIHFIRSGDPHFYFGQAEEHLLDAIGGVAETGSCHGESVVSGKEIIDGLFADKACVEPVVAAEKAAGAALAVRETVAAADEARGAEKSFVQALQKEAPSVASWSAAKVTSVALGAAIAAAAFYYLSRGTQSPESSQHGR